MSTYDVAATGWLPPVAQIRRADMGSLRIAVSRARHLVAEAEAVTRAVAAARTDPEWAGKAGADAAARHTELVAMGHILRSSLDDLADGIAAAAQGAEDAQDTLRRADLLAHQHGYVVDDSGCARPITVMTAPTTSPGSTGPTTSPDVVRSIEALVERSRARYAAAVASLAAVRAPVLDRAVAARPPCAGDLPLDREVVDDAPPLAGFLPLSGTRLASAFAGLTARQQAALIAAHPEWAGAAAGLPAWARDSANRALLAGLIPRLRAELEVARSDNAEFMKQPEVLTMGVARHLTEMAEARARLADAETLLELLGRDDGRKRQLLSLGWEGRRLTAAVASGDLDQAARLAVFVPGFTSTLATHLVQYDRDSAGAADLATQLVAQSGGSGEVVAIAWLGYAAPLVDEVLSPSRTVVRQEVALDGARKLADFLVGVDAAGSFSARSGQAPPIVVWAHSYGSLLAGLMFRNFRVPVERFVAFGSPGLGVKEVGQLQLPPGRVSAVVAPGDYVAKTGRFGKDPLVMPGVTILEAHAAPLPDGSPGGVIGGHSRYFEPGSTSAWNLAAIAAGRPELAVVEDACHVGGGLPATGECRESETSRRAAS